jgi:hypothetical protein
MANSRDFTGKNRKFTGTKAITTPKGTTGERVGAESGELRFNTTTSLMEYYDGTQWKPIDAPPLITSISPATFASDGSTLFTITVTGSNFGIGCTAKFIGNDATQYTPGTVTRVSSSSLTMTTLTTMTVANEPYDVQITNASGLSAILENALDAGSSPAFTVSAGTLGSLFNGNRAATALTSQTFGPATDTDGQQINYTITSGSISPGLRLGTANDGNNGKIVGTATAVVSNTTSTFTITATDGVNTASRQYSITVSAPVVESFTSSGTFSVPVGITAVDVLVVAGGGAGAGGGGGYGSGGGGGSGGLIFMPAAPVTPGGSVPITVGGGGAAAAGPFSGSPNGRGDNGQDSVFNSPTGVLTAKGGGSGGGGNAPSGPGNPGGSGGGSGGPGSGPQTGGSSTQPGQPGNSGTFGFGNSGGGSSGSAGGGGGGGAGGAGRTVTSPDPVGGTGGAGRTYDISGSSVIYAGGGGGGAHGPQGINPGAGGPGGGGTGGTGPGPGSTSGTTNRGGGGGGGGENPSPSGPAGSGGPGIVIVRY